MKRTVKLSVVCAALAAIGQARTAQAQTWSGAQLLNEPSEASVDVKTARVEAAKNGDGFHSIYHSASRVRYRRYAGGVLQPVVNVFPGTNFMANARLTEARNGDLHVVFEDWATDSPEVRWYKSTNGGATWPSTQLISASNGQAKHPHIVPFGTGTSGEVVMSYFRSSWKMLYYTRYNGSSWSADTYLGSGSHSEYDCFGMAWSPLDGSIFRSYDPNGSSMQMRRYNGTWEAAIPLYSGGWPVRQQMAINDSGQVMVLWDQDNKFWSILYTPGSGAGPVTLVSDQASWGTSLCSIPGSNSFYTAYAKNGPGRVYGRKFAGGSWLAEEQISSGLPDEFTVGPCVSADPTGSGTIYCAWEYWGSGKPQQYFSVRQGLPPGPRGTIAGVVRDQNTAAVANAVINIPSVDNTASAAGGTYYMTVPVGTYSVQCTKTSYTGQTVNNVVVTQNATTTVNFSIVATTPAAVTGLSVQGFDLRNRLGWSNPGTTNHTGTVIRYSTSAYPATPNDGTLLADVAASVSTYEHTGLTNGVTYYYTLFTYFQDASRFYGPGASGSGTATTAPKPNLLVNGTMNAFTSGVATGWTSYKVNDPNNAISFNTDTANYVTTPSQGIFGIDGATLPSSGYSAAGVRQVISGLTPGKIYQYMARQDLYVSDFGGDGRRYVMHFGINTSGGTTPGTLTFDGFIGGARWMTSQQVLYNNDTGSPTKYGGFHKSWASFPATSSSVSVWSGLTIDNAGAKDNVTAKFNTDYAFLFEWDLPANAGLQNGNFEGAIINLQNADAAYAGNDTIPSGWVPAGGSVGTVSDLWTEAAGARTGAYGVRVFNRRGCINGGLMQRIACTPGAMQTFTAYVQAASADGTTGAVGIDPTGGGDIQSASIYWTTTTSTAWTPITVSAVAQGPAVTVFIKSMNTNAGGTGGLHYTYFDDCTYQETNAPAPGTLAGTVTDACGTAMAGATVTTSPGGFSATTAANGSYTIASVPQGTYTVTASKAPYSDVSQGSVVINSSQTTTVNLAFNIGGTGSTITGYAYNQSGATIANATITTSPGSYVAKTAADGSYSITGLVAGTYSVTASATGYANLQRSVPLTGCNTAHIDFTLAPSTMTEKVINGAMDTPYRTFWGGEIPYPTCGIDPGSQCWGATWRGSFTSATWGQVSLGGSHGTVVRLSGLASAFEAGIIQQVPGLTPGDSFTFTAQAYQFDTGTTTWLGTDATGGTVLPNRQTTFDNVAGQWNTKSVSGTVGSNGIVTIFLWAYRQSGAGADVYFDNASLQVTSAALAKPAISRWPASLTASVSRGTNAAARTIEVSNAGQGTLNYSVSKGSTSWLTVSPTSGQSTGEVDALGVTFTTAALPAGTHNATITISDPNASLNPKTTSVTINVLAAADFDGDADVDGADYGFFAGCFNGTGNPITAACDAADLNGDNSVDGVDFGLFAGCFNGTGNPPACQ